MPNALYIHIPFCIQKCLYCDFFSVPYNESLAITYIDALCKELHLKKDSADTLRSIYIGGGTPSLLPDDCFQQLFKCLRENYHLLPAVEITVEANPGTVNESKINTMLSFGVNRLSIGVQSFNDTELKILGRIHISDDVLKSIEIMEKVGIKNFSIDLMYGIPGQTMDLWKESISKAVAFSPAHISTYELTPEKNTPLYELIKSNKIKMPEEEMILEMYNYAIDYLVSCGYEHYEISNFALQGFRCIHNLNYWNRGDYIGVGAGAHSFINNLRSRNTVDINKYIENLNKGISTEIESTMLTPEDSLKEFIFLGLRKTEGININKLPSFIPPLARGDTGGCNSLFDASKDMVAEGYLNIEKGYLRFTRRGIVISNTIIVRLFDKVKL